MERRQAAPATKPPAHSENVAAIEARVKAGEVVGLMELASAMQKDKQAAQAGQTQTPGKGASAKSGQQEQPSIREQIAAHKKQLATQKLAPARAAAQNKNVGLGD